MANYISYLNSLEKFGMNLGLERIDGLLEKLGNPHLKFKSIHVAGTNGKGSTCAIIASILKEAGYKVGLYTSPHLIDYTERIKINGKDISRKEFAGGIRRVKRAVEGGKGQRSQKGREGQPTVFEFLTAVAFCYFAKKKVDYAVVEVGLGGRLDATNVLTPLVSVITNIDYEHTGVLGKTLAKIAREKAGIIKTGVPVVTAERKAEPLKVIKAVCWKKKNLLIEVGSRGLGEEAGLEVGSGLWGRHQQVNAACAIAAIRAAGIKVLQPAIKNGLSKVSWPGRFQIISHKPPTMTILDGAHNPAGMRTLVQTLREKYPKRKFQFVFGNQADKDCKAMLKLIKPLAQGIIFTHSTHPQAVRQGTVGLARALETTRNSDRVITGSLYLLGDALKEIGRL